MCSGYVLKDLDDAALLERLTVLVGEDNQLTAVLLAHVGEVDERKLYLARGCSSMFTYCLEVLKMSEGEAYKRIHAARAARAYPLIFELVASGGLHLSGVTLLASRLTAENHRQLLGLAAHKSKRAIEELLAAREPKPDVKVLIRKLPSPPAQAPGLFEGAAKATCPPPARIDPPKVAPLAEDRFKVQLTVSRKLKEKIETAKALLRHKVPGGDLEQVFEHAIDELLASLMRKKFAATPKPKAAPASPKKRTRSVPAAIKRAVAARDGLQCTFVSTDGRRCTETGFLELDHKHPYAKGGAHTVENLRLRCRGHNAYAAELEYGKDHMKQHSPGKVGQKNSCPQVQLFP